MKVWMMPKEKYWNYFFLCLKNSLRVIFDAFWEEKKTFHLTWEWARCKWIEEIIRFTLSICNWSLKLAAPNVIVAVQEMFALSNCVTRSLTANEWTSSFCENVVTVSHLKRRIKAMRAGLCDESGITVRKKKGNSSLSLKAGAVLPNDTFKQTNREKNCQTTRFNCLPSNITLLELYSNREQLLLNFPSPPGTQIPTT